MVIIDGKSFDVFNILRDVTVLTPFRLGYVDFIGLSTLTLLYPLFLSLVMAWLSSFVVAKFLPFDSVYLYLLSFSVITLARAYYANSFFKKYDTLLHRNFGKGLGELTKLDISWVYQGRDGYLSEGDAMPDQD